jgi:hypothetical protein
VYEQPQALCPARQIRYCARAIFPDCDNLGQPRSDPLGDGRDLPQTGLGLQLVEIGGTFPPIVFADQLHQPQFVPS